LKIVDWQNSVLSEKDPATSVSELKRQEGKIISVGSLSIASQLFKENLIDEFWFAIHPVISGKGPRLFDGIDINTELKFVDSKKLNSGVVVLHYNK
jgi:dihydrofolate reductase